MIRKPILCLSSNPFLFITIWIAHVWKCKFPGPTLPSLALFHALSKKQKLSSAFSIASALFAENAGVYSNYSLSGTAASPARTAGFAESHFSSDVQNAILAACLCLQIRTVQTAPSASVPRAFTLAPSNPPRAPRSSSASARPPILLTPSIPAFLSSPVPATNLAPNRARNFPFALASSVVNSARVIAMRFRPLSLCAIVLFLPTGVFAEKLTITGTPRVRHRRNQRHRRRLHAI